MVGAAVILLAVAILIALGHSLARQRAATLASAEQTTRNLVQVIEEQARGGLDATDVTLAAIARTLPLLRRAHEPRDREVHELLRANLRTLPFVRAIWVLDEQGRMIHDSDNLRGRYNLADREYFRVHRDNRVQGMHIDPPVLGRERVWFVSASRRIDRPDGRFAGVVAAAVEPRYFDRFYESIAVGRDGVVEVLRLDGTVVTRAPGGAQLRGRQIEPAHGIDEGVASGATATSRDTSAVDGVERIVSARRIGDRPLVVRVGLGVSETLAGWRAVLLTQSLSAAVFVLLLAVLGWLVVRELRSRQWTQTLISSHRAVLEAIASGAPLAETLDALVRLIESQSPGTIGSILLLDEDGVHLRHAAAPGLPTAYTAAIDGQRIGEQAGPWGAAAFRRQRVIVEDVETDPLWDDDRELARAHGLRAGWSAPIFDRHERLVGTFVLYFRVPRRPSERDLRLVEVATSTAGIAIGRHREEQALRLANERLQMLSRSLLDVQEKERAALARELHDQLGQSLTALKLNAAALARTLEGPAADRMQQSLAIADQALAGVRSLALDLRPPQLDQLGLAAALRDAVTRLGDQAGLRADFVDRTGGVRLDTTLATVVFRVAQEALTNVSRHAEAKHVVVGLHARAGELRLLVADDGTGFDYDAARAQAIKGTSMGILGMEERVALAGGRLRVTSRPRKGTRVYATFPLAGRPGPVVAR
jgi:signal transduction histidine kinase